MPLSNLDKHFPGAASSDGRPGYDSRHYGHYNHSSSLEAQLPGRTSASTTTTQSHPRTYNSYGSIQTDHTMSSSGTATEQTEVVEVCITLQLCICMYVYVYHLMPLKIYIIVAGKQQIDFHFIVFFLHYVRSFFTQL